MNRAHTHLEKQHVVLMAFKQAYSSSWVRDPEWNLRNIYPKCWRETPYLGSGNLAVLLIAKKSGDNREL